MPVCRFDLLRIHGWRIASAADMRLRGSLCISLRQKSRAASEVTSQLPPSKTRGSWRIMRRFTSRLRW